MLPPSRCHPRLRLPGCRLGGRYDRRSRGRTGKKGRGVRRYCCAVCALLHCRTATPPCHSGLRAGILGSLMRGIVLPLIASPVFHPRQHLPRPRIKCGVTARLRRLCCSCGHCRGCHRFRLPHGSLARQLGGGSVFRASTVALTLHQLSGSSPA